MRNLQHPACKSVTVSYTCPEVNTYPSIHTCVLKKTRESAHENPHREILRDVSHIYATVFYPCPKVNTCHSNHTLFKKTRELTHENFHRGVLRDVISAETRIDPRKLSPRNITRRYLVLKRELIHENFFWEIQSYVAWCRWYRPF